MSHANPYPDARELSLGHMPQDITHTLTASKRAASLSDTPEACESRAARHYRKHLLPRLSEWQGTDERRRVPGAREGVNGIR